MWYTRALRLISENLDVKQHANSLCDQMVLLQLCATTKVNLRSG